MLSAASLWFALLSSGVGGFFSSRWRLSCSVLYCFFPPFLVFLYFLSPPRFALRLASSALFCVILPTSFLPFGLIGFGVYCGILTTCRVTLPLDLCAFFFLLACALARGLCLQWLWGGVAWLPLLHLVLFGAMPAAFRPICWSVSWRQLCLRVSPTPPFILPLRALMLRFSVLRILRLSLVFSALPLRSGCWPVRLIWARSPLIFVVAVCPRCSWSFVNYVCLSVVIWMRFCFGVAFICHPFSLPFGVPHRWASIGGCRARLLLHLGRFLSRRALSQCIC